MAYHRSTKEAYQKWADDVGDQTYSFENMLPFFQKSIHYTPPDEHKRAQNATPEVDLSTFASNRTDNRLSVTFPNYAQLAAFWVQKAFPEIGINYIPAFTSEDLTGSAYTLATINATTQTRDSSETSFLASCLGNYNLTVYISSLATKIVFDTNKTATSVEVNTQGLKYTLSAKKEVVLSAGSFQSPQLLLVSGVGDQKTLNEHQLPDVAHRPGVAQNMWVSVVLDEAGTLLT
jgi:choline dehydrogenase